MLFSSRTLVRRRSRRRFEVWGHCRGAPVMRVAYPALSRLNSICESILWCSEWSCSAACSCACEVQPMQPARLAHWHDIKAARAHDAKASGGHGVKAASAHDAHYDCVTPTCIA